MNEDQIKSKIKEILSDSRLLLPPADVTINAPLALIQVSLKAQLFTLQEVIGMPKTNLEELRKSKS